jgi:hypothetical protein
LWSVLVWRFGGWAVGRCLVRGNMRRAGDGSGMQAADVAVLPPAPHPTRVPSAAPASTCTHTCLRPGG